MFKHGEVAEWSKAAVSKTVVLLLRDRGFESHPLRSIVRYMKYLPILCVLCVLVMNPFLSHADDIQTAIDSAVRGEYQKAINDAGQILAKSPDNLRARLVLSHLYLETGGYAKAESLLEYFPAITESTLSKLNPLDLLWLARGTWVYATRKGDKNLFQRVVRDYLPMIEKLSDDPILHSALYIFWGNCYLEKGDLPAAAGCFSDTLKANPSSAEAYLGLAKAYYITSNRQKALENINIALSLLPITSDAASIVLPIISLRAEAYNLMASAQLINDQFSNALNSVNNALTINPNAISFRATKASIYYLNNNLADFNKECLNVMEVNKNPALFYLTIADNLDRRLFYMEATGFYEKTLSMDEHLWDARTATGFNYMHLGPDFEGKGRKLLDEAF